MLTDELYINTLGRQSVSHKKRPTVSLTLTHKLQKHVGEGIPEMAEDEQREEKGDGRNKRSRGDFSLSKCSY